MQKYSGRLSAVCINVSVDCSEIFHLPCTALYRMCIMSGINPFKKAPCLFTRVMHV